MEENYEESSDNEVLESMEEEESMPINLMEELVEDEEEEEKKTVRQIVDKFINEGMKRGAVELISAVFSFTTFVIYIASTYYSEEDFRWFNYLDYCVCSFFLLEFLMNFYLAQHRFLFFVKSESLVDFFTFILPYLADLESQYLRKAVEIARTMRIIRVTRYLSKNLKKNENEVAKHITIMILSALTLILIFTLVFRIFEIDRINYYIMNPDYHNIRLINQSQFHDFLYYIVVTLSTVGYGDIYPLTEEGRLVIVFLILLALYLIPKQTNELIKLMSISSVYSRAVYQANPEVPHIVICGNVKVDDLKNICLELFHTDHGTQDKNAVIIQNSLPVQEMKVFLHAGVYEVFLRYLQGNPLYEKDLRRSDILCAKACVIMTDKNSSDPHLTDHQNILLSLAIKKYFLFNNLNSQLFIQLIKPENKIHYLSGLQSLSKSYFTADQVIIVEEIKMNLLSKSCLIPGIIAMVSNLVISSGSQGENVNCIWMEEYAEGSGHEIYRTLLNDSLKNKTFSKLSSDIFLEYEAIVFALEIEIEGKTIITLNPGSFYIERLQNGRDDIKIYIYIICSDKAVADRIETAEGIIEKVEESNEISPIQKKSVNTKFDAYMKLNIEDTLQIDENADPNNENAEVEEDYFIIKDDVKNNIDVKLDSIRNSERIFNHIILCGTHPSLYYFILPLRARYLGEENLKTVVILSEDMPKELWDSISRFKDIYLINGSPLNTEDLYRANIEYADKVVILECDQDSYSSEDIQMIDSQSVFIYKAIKKCNQTIQIMTEVVYANNIEFLLPNQELSSLIVNNAKLPYSFTSLFAAGEVYISSIIDTLTSQAYYNPHIVTIVSQLLTGGKNMSNSTMLGICENVGLKSSNLWQIPIPENFINKTFKELYTELAEKEHLITMGLYRLPGARDNEHPFVYTNPLPDTRLTHRDKLFVLAVGNINGYLKKYSKEKATNKQNDKQQNEAPMEGSKSNKMYKYLEVKLSEIENYVAELEIDYEQARSSLKESISNAVRQEVSTLLH